MGGETVVQDPLDERVAFGRTVAVTAIEHRNIVITVASQIRESESGSSFGTDCSFVTTIWEGRLAAKRGRGTIGPR
jgi:hypothetical protein